MWFNNRTNSKAPWTLKERCFIEDRTLFESSLQGAIELCWTIGALMIERLSTYRPNHKISALNQLVSNDGVDGANSFGEVRSIEFLSQILVLYL